MTKRLFALLLVLVMMVGAMSVTSYAIWYPSYRGSLDDDNPGFNGFYSVDDAPVIIIAQEVEEDEVHYITSTVVGETRPVPAYREGVEVENASPLPNVAPEANPNTGLSLYTATVVLAAGVVFALAKKK